MNRIQWEGRYRGDVTSWELYQAKAPSKSVSVSCRFELVEGLLKSDDGSWNWVPIEGGPYEAFGKFWVVGKAGNILGDTVETLGRVFGWDGSLRTVLDSPAPPQTRCQATVTQDEYKGNPVFDVAFLDAYDAERPNYSPDESEVAKLENVFGSQLKAIAAKGRSEAVATDAPDAVDPAELAGDAQDPEIDPESVPF